MSDTTLRPHPLIVIAATTLILTCLIAIAVMLGLIPSPLARDRALAREETTTTTPANRSVNSEQRLSSSLTPDERAERRADVGATTGVGPSQTVRGAERAPRVAAVCTNCGTVTSVRVVKEQGEAGLIGPAAGTAVGGLIGSQIGSGSGKTIATIVGAAGGAAAGTEIERRYKATTHYVVGVRLHDGTTRSFTYASAPGLREGDKVKIVDGRLARAS